MVSGLFQHPKVYIIIAQDDELVGRLKVEFSKKPLVEVYVLSPKFFLQPEFVHNPLWQKDISRIIWVLQNEQSVLEVAAITRFLVPWQESTTILGLVYSPPPTVGDIKLRQFISGWKSRVESDEDVKTRVLLNLPKVGLVIGQDVLLDSWTKKTPLKEILDLTVANSLPVMTGLTFYWQTLDEFLDTAWDKLFNPLVGMRFWVCGKKTNGKTFTARLGEIWENLTKGSWQQVPSGEVSARIGGKIKQNETPFFSQQIWTKQNNDQVEQKWNLFLKLAVKEYDQKQADLVMEGVIEEKQKDIQEKEKTKKKEELKSLKGVSLFPGLNEPDWGKSLFGKAQKQIDQANAMIGKAKEVLQKVVEDDGEISDVEKILQEKVQLRAQIRPLGGSSQKSTSKKSEKKIDPLKLMVKPVDEEILEVGERTSTTKENVTKNVITAAGLKSVRPQARISWLERNRTDRGDHKTEEKKGKSRLVEPIVEKKPIKKAKSLTTPKLAAQPIKAPAEIIQLKTVQVEQELNQPPEEKVIPAETAVINNEVTIEGQKTSKKEGKKTDNSSSSNVDSLKVDLDRYDEVREKILAAGKTQVSPTSSKSELSSRDKKKQKFKKRVMIVTCFAVAGLILVIGGFWWVWQRSEKSYYVKLGTMLEKCSSEEGCDWSAENQELLMSAQGFKRQLDIYQPILSLTKQSEFANWEKLTDQRRKYQENQNHIESNWTEIYFAVMSRKSDANSPLLWQNQENLIWQNDQLILNMLTMLDKAEVNPWLSSASISKIKTQLKQEQTRNNQTYQSASFWRQVWGQNGSRNYAVLLFNAEHLRPGGGVMEAVLDVQMIDGQIKKIVPYSAAALNSKVALNTASNSKITGYLGKSNANLMDVGFDGDFEIAANKAQWYLTRMIGKEFDGIIGINSNYIRESIENYNEEVVLRQSGEKINKSNYQELVQKQSQLAETSQARGQFFSDLLTSYIQKQMLLSSEEVPVLAQKLKSGINKGQLEIWMENEELEGKARQIGVSGSLLTPDCNKLFGTQNCQSDSLYYFVTDLSGGGQSTMPKMSWSEEIALMGEGIKHEVKLNWEQIAGMASNSLNKVMNEGVSGSGNTEEGNAGRKRYYLQFYLPQNAFGVNLLLDGVQTNLDTENGVLVDFGNKSKVNLTLSYTLTNEEGVGGDGFIYTYLHHAPVGLEGAGVTVQMRSELDKPYKLISPWAEQENLDLRFTGKSEEDLFITVGI